MFENMLVVAACARLSKYLELPLLSKPMLPTLKAISTDVRMLMAIHQITPWKAPRPKMPAVIPMKIFETTLLLSIEVMFNCIFGAKLRSKYFV